MWTYNKTNSRQLKSLCETVAPSTKEMGVQRIIAEYFKSLNIKCYGDAIGNLYARLNPEANFNIAIVAHADEVGLQVTDITKQGLLKFRKLGGVRCTSMIGQKIEIMTAKGNVLGIVGSDPLQNNGTDSGLTLKTDDLWVDIGADNYEVATTQVAIGDYGVFAPEFMQLNKHRVCSKSLDDRLGVFVMCQVMESLHKENLRIGVTAISSVLEEINMHGIMACEKDFQAAIVLDVDFATDVPTDYPEMGMLELGKGIGININADSNSIMQKIFVETMTKNQLPFQSTLGRNISGGTDASKLHACGNIATLNVNLPLRYMHSRYEMCDIRDINCAVESVVKFIKQLEKNNTTDFVPWKNL